MNVRYKKGGKVWRRDVWLPPWNGCLTPWPKRRSQTLRVPPIVIAMAGHR